MIFASQGFGIVLEAWKITKTVNVRIRPPPPNSYLSFLPYVIAFEDKHKLSETEKKTQEYDEIAFKWLYIIAVPLLTAYAVYSLIYQQHKSWYSFIIETLVGSVYAYGFLMMVPSLYINYRLKVGLFELLYLSDLLTKVSQVCRSYAWKGSDVQIPQYFY
jgi:Cleft lip and palate transmembrane protein 1 (CLPTM1)